MTSILKRLPFSVEIFQHCRHNKIMSNLCCWVVAKIMCLHSGTTTVTLRMIKVILLLWMNLKKTKTVRSIIKLSMNPTSSFLLKQIWCSVLQVMPQTMFTKSNHFWFWGWTPSKCCGWRDNTRAKWVTSVTTNEWCIGSRGDRSSRLSWYGNGWFWGQSHWVWWYSKIKRSTWVIVSFVIRWSEQFCCIRRSGTRGVSRWQLIWFHDVSDSKNNICFKQQKHTFLRWYHAWRCCC